VKPMDRVLAADIHGHVGKRVRLAGWLHHRRELSRLTFLLLRDRSGITQVVLEGERIGQASALAPESVLEIEGDVVANSQAPAGAEVVEPSITVVALADPLPPVELHRPRLKESLPHQLDHAAISLRHPRRRAVAEIAAASLNGFRSTLDGLGFREIATPKLVSSATESGANVFTIDYFGRPAYLAQSPQLYKQVMVGVLERVYEIGPVFRAEPSDTVRHLAEYLSLDVEMGFIDSHRDVMELAVHVLDGMAVAVRERAASACRLLALNLPEVPAEIPVIDFVAAQQMIEDATGERIVGELDLAPAHERWLGNWARTEHGSDFVFVVGYPLRKRPFYTHPDPARPEFSNSFDLIFRGAELMTGGQRLHRHEDYLEALGAIGQEPSALAGYLEAFKHGMPPHGGFAIGLERWLWLLTSASNVREVTLFPRDLDRLTP
jgi:nondiscriminating aspartyl-tRNA synthetase